MRLENTRTNRFWTIERRGTEVTTTFGVIGRDGGGNSRTLEDEAAARAYERRAVAERLADGYRRVGEPPAELDAIEAELARRPDDPDLSLVWTDLLLAAEDPRGEYLALEHAIRTATADEAARALELSARQARLVLEHGKFLLKRPGGFPFRPRWRGRRYILFGSEWNHRIRGKGGVALLERVERFIAERTDAEGPTALMVGGYSPSLTWRRPDRARVTRGDAPAGRVARALGPGFWDGNNVFERERAGPVQDPAELRRLVQDTERIWLSWDFRLAWPGSRLPLPQQEAGHHAGAEPLRSSLAVELQGRDIQLRLSFPYEDFVDPRFLAVHDGVTASLGRCLSKSHFSLLSPTADGKRLKGKLHVFDRPRFHGRPIPHE